MRREISCISRKIPQKSRLRRPNPRFSLMKVVFWALKIGIFACGALVGGRSPPTTTHPGLASLVAIATFRALIHAC